MSFILDGKSIPFADFEKTFPGWKIPNLALEGANGEYRQMFFYCYQEELARYYDSKKSSVINNTTYTVPEFRRRLKNLADKGTEA